jgi:hypothetical protein
MPTFGKVAAMGAVFFVGIAVSVTAFADQLCDAGAGGSASRGSSQSPGRTLAALPPADTAPPPAGIVLPDINVLGLKIHPRPYSTPGVGPRVSSFGTIRAEHYEVPLDFDANVPLHPYTSGMGPWPGPGDKGTAMAGTKPPSHHNR